MFDWIDQHPNWAAWVQAVGSIVAIGIAIWVPYSQARSHEQEDRQNRGQEVGSLKAALRAEIQQGIEILEMQAGSMTAHAEAQHAPSMGFHPIPPLSKVFDANCGKLGLLNADTVRELLRYYFRVDALRRFAESGNTQTASEFSADVTRRKEEANKAIASLQVD